MGLKFQGGEVAAAEVTSYGPASGGGGRESGQRVPGGHGPHSGWMKSDDDVDAGLCGGFSGRLVGFGISTSFSLGTIPIEKSLQVFPCDFWRQLPCKGDIWRHLHPGRHPAGKRRRPMACVQFSFVFSFRCGNSRQSICTRLTELVLDRQGNGVPPQPASRHSRGTGRGLLLPGERERKSRAVRRKGQSTGHGRISCFPPPPPAASPAC